MVPAGLSRTSRTILSFPSHPSVTESPLAILSPTASSVIWAKLSKKTRGRGVVCVCVGGGYEAVIEQASEIKKQDEKKNDIYQRCRETNGQDRTTSARSYRHAAEKRVHSNLPK